MRSSRYYIAIICLLAAAVGTYALSLQFQPDEETETDTDKNASAVQASQQIAIDNTEVFHEDRSIYDYDHTTVDTLYVTVKQGTEAEGTNHTFDEVNAYRNTQDMTGPPKILANAIVKAGDQNGPLPGALGYTEDAANATINVRGRTSTGYQWKSYKLKLFKDEDTWNGSRTIALNKHPADTTRLRNMLYFDLASQVPYLTSLRTHFVHLYVCDDTKSGDGSGAYKDFGLFTQVEQPNSTMLREHGLSSGGTLYKANMNEFFRNEDYIKLATDANYDEDKFNQVLEVKTTQDHTKLINMLNSVNNYEIPIEETVEKYFDIDNLLSYIAFNLIMGNPDSNAQNYYIYSPVNSEKWYVLPWDGDACLHYYEYDAIDFQFREGDWTKGISDYMAVVLYNRMFHEPKYREMLTDRIEYLHDHIVNEETVNKLIEKYRAVVDPYIETDPDLTSLRYPLEVRDDVLKNMAHDVEVSYDYYYKSLDIPSPFYLADVENREGKLEFTWDASVSFNNEMISYEFQIADSPDFNEESIKKVINTYNVKVKTDMLSAGTYFFRVIAKDESGHEAMAFDLYNQNGIYNGIRMFTVDKNGKVATH